jgi:hypothetical protein
MATVLEEYSTEEQCSAVQFLWAKDSMQRILIKKRFLFKEKSVCRVKRFATGSRNCHLIGKHFGVDEEIETELRKWLRQQSKDFYAAGFDPLVKRWDKYINVGVRI